MKYRMPLIVTIAVAIAGCSAPLDSSPANGADPASPVASAPVANAAANGARPANVPPEFQITPQGYFHPSCLVEVHHGERVGEDGNIIRADGSVRQVPACTTPSYDRAGIQRSTGAIHGSMHVEQKVSTGPLGPLSPLPRIPVGNTVAPGISHAWLADLSTTLENVTFFSTQFKVPPAPYKKKDQVVFFFNGIEPSDNSAIIQPVLQWNWGSWSNRWSIASWYYIDDAHAYHSTPVDVNPGDTLDGYMYPGSNSWNIVMNVNGAYSNDLVANTGTKNFDWLFGGVLEVYGIDSCDELPDQPFEFFSNQYILQKGVPATVQWSSGLASETGLTPNCNISASSGSTLGYITWATD